MLCPPRVVGAVCVLVSLTLSLDAQTIVPAARDAEIGKEDIFERLTPLSPAPEPTTPAPESEAVETSDEAEPATPPTTVRLRQPEPTTPPPTSSPPAINLESSTTAAVKPATPSNQSPPTLTPKLRALLTPAAQSSAPPPKIPAHAPGAMTALTADELRTLINHAAREFHGELGKTKPGEGWQKYLRLEELQAACRVEADEAAVEKLPAIGERFAALAVNAEYKTVTKRSGFQTLHLALGEYLSPAEQRTERQRLLASVETLQQALTSVGTGAQWAGFFELAALARLAASPSPVSEHDLVQLQLLLARFEHAATDDKFQAVAKLEGFAATQTSLRGILGVSASATPPETDLSRPEPSAQDEFAIPDDATASLAQATATVERLPVAGEGMQLVSLGGKAFLRKRGDAAWKQIGKLSAAPGDAIAARDEAAQVVLGESFALQLAAQTTVTVDQRQSDAGAMTILTLTTGSVKAIANARTGGGHRLNLAVGDYQLAVSGDDFAVEFRVEKNGRAVAVVHAGEATVENQATGDRAIVRAGREAVLLASGIALRGAPPKVDDWWMAPPAHPRSARRNGGGFSE